MKVLVTGANGQLGWELQQTRPEGVEAIFCGREQLNIADEANVKKVFDEVKPDIVINAAAYTAVDKAESDRENAFLINESGAVNLANAAKAHGAYLIHISTDFVFDGKGCRPYLPAQQPNPIGVYGESKLAGEKAIAAVEGLAFAIVRTAWVYSAHGGNFVKSMLRLMADKPQLGIVADQIGTPTWAKGLAKLCWQAIETKPQGIFHWTDAGAASWYDFAVAIQNLGIEKGLLDKAIVVKPIATEDYPTPASRPSYSVLNKSSLLAAIDGCELVHWQTQLGSMLDELKEIS